MNLITDLTRMWLTKSIKPFVFTSEYDKRLDYDDVRNMGLYVHIPFCRQICDFCPYCKEIYDREKCNTYIDYLIDEIHMAGKMQSEKKKVTSLYFGGGSPALAVDRIKEIIDVINNYFEISDGVGIELHPSDLKPVVLKKLKEAGVTKISIGIQSFNEKYQDVLGRVGINKEEIKKVLKETDFETVSMDFIFALPGQTFEDLKKDIDTAFNTGANHIAIYPFIDFTFTKSKVEAMGKKQKRHLLDSITRYCEKSGYVRDSIWTFSLNKTAKYSSMTRDNFLGFGTSATTLLKDQFKINTFSVDEYINRIKSGHLPTALTIKFSLRQRMIYYLFWTAYTTKLDSQAFEEFFGVPLRKMYGSELFLAQKLGYITKNGDIYSMTLKGSFYYHYYENFYTLSYIDKMWGIMRENPFPDGMKL